MAKKRSSKSNHKNRKISKKDLIQELDKADEKYKEVYKETINVEQDYNNLLEVSSDTIYKCIELFSSIKNVPVKEKKRINNISIQFEEYENSKTILKNERKKNIKESLIALAILLFGGAAKYYIDNVSDDDSDTVKGISILVAIAACIAFIIVKIKNHLKSIKALSKSLNKAKLETERLLRIKELMLTTAKEIKSAKMILVKNYERLAFTYGTNYRELDSDTQKDLGSMFNNTESLVELLKTEITV